MKRLWLGGVLLLLTAGVVARLSYRWHDERSDRNLALVLDWSEMHEGTMRQAISESQLLVRLKASGANTLLVGAATVRDYLSSDFAFPQKAQAEVVYKQLADRGVSGLRIKPLSGTWQIIRPGLDWEPLADVEVGFNHRLLESMQQAGFHVVLRVNHDPWLEKAKLFADLDQARAETDQVAYLLNTDEIPGGADALSLWRDWVQAQSARILLFEFHPAKSAMKLARMLPACTFRAHTIAPNELKELTDGQERSRWYRAIQERSCRFLLMHASPTQSIDEFLVDVRRLKTSFEDQGWFIAWPLARPQWARQPFLPQRLGSLLALLAAIGVPIAALRKGSLSSPWKSFLAVTIFTLAGSILVAALADNPLTRVQIVPFRGIKLAFVAAWLGCFLSLYSWEEIREQLERQIRRVDLLAIMVAGAVLGYLLLRMGNAGAGWKVGWEQGLRDRLEEWLVVRPRFKEFAVGYPLLLLGFDVLLRRKTISFWADGRLLITLGMIGPISVVNTFCHLHSPLHLALWRSINGIALGGLLGYLLIEVSHAVRIPQMRRK